MTHIPQNVRRLIWLAIVMAFAVWLGFRIVQQQALARIVRADPDRIMDNADDQRVALARGRHVFAANCAGCHGAEGRGNIGNGTPDLTDSDELYGTERVSDVEAIVRHGIRSGDRQSKDLAYMPAYAHANPYERYRLAPLSPAQVEDLTQFLLSYSDRESDRDAANRGGVAFAGKAGCYDCHLRDARGDTAIGAPNLTDNIWLYGGSPRAIRMSIEEGRRGRCPAFARRLSAADIRAVAAYIVSLSPKRASIDQ